MTLFGKSGGPGDGGGYSPMTYQPGVILIKTINDSYGTIVEMILELVQNGIDANARHVAVFVNKKSRNITVADDGDGVSKEKYERALQSVLQTMKTRDKFGQFGMGMLSPLAKCEWHKLTSCPKDGQTYLEWTFNTEEIRKQDHYPLKIPYRPRDDLRYETDPRGFPKGVTKVQYRTLVEVHKYTDDKFKSRVPSADGLFDEIVKNYREKMLENSIKLSVTITSEKGDIDKKEGCAEPYTGKRLPEVKLYNGDCGTSYFHLYLARKNEKGKYIGQGVSMGEADNAYRFEFRSFARSVAGLLSSTVVEALNSGVFEGNILTERTKLHSNRRSFEQGDALTGLCQTIETWYEQVGKEYYEAAIESRDEEHYKGLVEDLKRTLEDLMKNDPKYAEMFKRVKDGVRNKTLKPDKDGVLKPDIEGTVDRKLPKPQPVVEPEPDDDPGPEPQPGQAPKVVKKPPRKRASVKSDKLGLEFRHGELYDDPPKLWLYEPGVLTFNILHDRWMACEGSTRREKQLQEWIAIQVLTIEADFSDDSTMHAAAELFAEQMVDPFTYLLLNSPNYQHISRKKGKKEEPAE